MKKPTRLLSNMRTGVLTLAAPMMLIACEKSPEERISAIDNNIEKTLDELNGIYVKDERAALDSANKNTAFINISKQLESRREHMDSLHMRNNFLADSVIEDSARKIARNYPLNQFMTPAQIKTLVGELRHGVAPWARNAAQNIIRGRGTLLDLYRISYELDYIAYNAPFHILDNRGAVRFGKPELDARATQFDAMLDSIEPAIISGAAIQGRPGDEYRANNRQIESYDSLGMVHDNIYEGIERHFLAQDAKRLKFLEKKLSKLRNRRNQLVK